MRILARLVIGAVLLGTVTAAQGSDPLRLYTEALDRETTLRTEMAGATAPAATQRRLRTLVGAYRDIARLFPSSGVADKALWQGGMLAADAFARWGDPSDRTAAQRAFDALAKSFPTSGLARRVPEQSKRLAQVTPLPPRPDAAARPDVQPAAHVAQPPFADAPAAAAPPAAEAVRPLRPPLSRRPTSTAAAVAPSTAPTAPTGPAAPAASAPSTPPAANSTSASAPALGTALLTAVRHESLPEAFRVVLDVDRETAFSSDRLDNPSRVFVDLRHTRAPESLRDAVLPVDDGAVKRIRIGRQPGGLTRVVLDLTAAGRYSVYSLYDPYRVVIDVEASPTRSMPRTPAVVPTAARVPPATPLAARAPATATVETTAATMDPARTPRVPVDPPTALAPLTPPRASPARIWALALHHTTARTPADAVSHTMSSFSEDVVTAAPVARPSGPPAPDEALVPPTAASKTARGDYSLSRQLGLGIARIVIDAGHGGHDPGAKIRGLSEADFVMDIARRLEQLLRAQPGVEVVQTRKGDVYVSLEERADIANRANGDLFISIHANASDNPKTRGVETYVLNFATSKEAEAIAARENAGSARTMGQLSGIVRAIATNNKLDESRELARFVQDSLHSQLRTGDRAVRNLGVKQAPFMVLVGATMPAVLTEVAFLTNQEDAPLLKSDKYRQEVATALLRGITRYQQSLKKGSPEVASQ